ncbi:MAG: hypothetical protein AAF530_12495 [Pseudomonadota bacterium]
MRKGSAQSGRAYGGNVYPFPAPSNKPRPSTAQESWLRRGLAQPGGKLPLFDEEGQRYSVRTIRSCIDRGWAEPWFVNPLKDDWLICRLTPQGRDALKSE